MADPLAKDYMYNTKLAGWRRLPIQSIRLCVLASILFIIGWIFSIKVLIRPSENVSAVNPLTAICILLLSISILLHHSATRGNRKNHIWNYLSKGLAGCAWIFALIRISNYLFGIDFEIDEIFFHESLLNYGADIGPYKMGISTATVFFLIASALLVLPVQPKNRKFADVLLILGIFISFFSVIAYLYLTLEFFDLEREGAMSPYTSIYLIILSFSTMFLGTRTGIVKEIELSPAGYLVARIFIPAAFLIPVEVPLRTVRQNTMVHLPKWSFQNSQIKKEY